MLPIGSREAELVPSIKCCSCGTRFEHRPLTNCTSRFLRPTQIAKSQRLCCRTTEVTFFESCSALLCSSMSRSMVAERHVLQNSLALLRATHWLSQGPGFRSPEKNSAMASQKRRRRRRVRNGARRGGETAPGPKWGEAWRRAHRQVRSRCTNKSLCAARCYLGRLQIDATFAARFNLLSAPHRWSTRFSLSCGVVAQHMLTVRAGHAHLP